MAIIWLFEMGYYLYDTNFCSFEWSSKFIEKAAIGRRVSETEFDLMNMIKNQNFL